MTAPDDVLRTARLTLRHFTPDDAPALHRVFADAEAMRFWSTPPHRALAETEDYVRRTIEATLAGRGDDFVVIHDGAVVGKAGLWNDTEIGFIFARPVWGLGIAGEAVHAIMARAAQRGTGRIRADVDPRNARAIRLLKRCGFVEAGSARRTMQVGATWVDSVYFEADPRR